MKQALLLGVILLLVLLAGGAVVARGKAREGQAQRGKLRLLPPDRDRPVLYVALGDSTVYGVGASHPERHYVSGVHARLRAIYPRAQLANLGVSGATAADVVRDQLQRAVVLQPQLITVSIGPNDITGGRDVREYERDIATIFRTLIHETDAVLVVNLIPDLAVAPRFAEAEKAAVGRQTILFNEALQRQGRQYGVELVDLYGPSQRDAPQHPEWVAGDGYHPSDEGYAVWAALLWQGIQARMAD